MSNFRPERYDTTCMRGEFWYALYTRHQHEKIAADMLGAKGFQVFLPLYSVSHQWKDRVKHLSLPLFPSYVFIRTSLDRRLHIVTTPGVHAFVGVEGRAARIPDVEIEAVRRTVENLLQVEPHPFLRTGDRVRVKSGPLEGIEGILVRKTNQYRLVLCVEMLQKSVAVEVDPSVVERLQSGSAGYGSSLERPLASCQEVAGRHTVGSKPLEGLSNGQRLEGRDR